MNRYGFLNCVLFLGTIVAFSVIIWVAQTLSQWIYFAIFPLLVGMLCLMINVDLWSMRLPKPTKLSKTFLKGYRKGLMVHRKVYPIWRVLDVCHRLQQSQALVKAHTEREEEG
jgi:hypothetical protein